MLLTHQRDLGIMAEWKKNTEIHQFAACDSLISWSHGDCISKSSDTSEKLGFCAWGPDLGV